MISCADLSTGGCFRGWFKRPDKNDPENLGRGGLIFNYGSCLRAKGFNALSDMVKFSKEHPGTFFRLVGIRDMIRN